MSNTEVTKMGTQDRPRFFVPENPEQEQKTLIMRVITYDTRETDYGKRAMVLGEELGTGIIWSKLIYGAVLTREFAQQRPNPGEVVQLEYLGQGTVKGGKFEGKPFANWRVQVLRGPRTVNWDTLDTDTDAELVPINDKPEAVEGDVPIDTRELPQATVVEDELPF
jgi:hypothetical protein